MKKRIAAAVISGALLGGGVAIPWMLAAQPAHAAPAGPWVNQGTECAVVFHPSHIGTLYVNTTNNRTLCFFG